MRIFKIILSALFLTASVTCFAQADEGDIVTDRPSQSTGTYTLPKNKFQIESGLEFGKEDETYFLSDHLLRYGLFQKTELRLIADYYHSSNANGLKPLTIGIKQNITENHGWVPAIAVIGYAAIPKLASAPFRNEEAVYTGILAFENKITDNFGITYNIAENIQKHHYPEWEYMTTLNFDLVKHVSAFAEYFGNYSSGNKPSHNLDAGVQYLLSKRLQLDMALGSDIYFKEKKFVTTGISYRF